MIEESKKYVEVSSIQSIIHMVSISKGHSGSDEVSTETCSKCWSEAGDSGIKKSYTWNKEKEGWDVTAVCQTCGDFRSWFIKYIDPTEIAEKLSQSFSNEDWFVAVGTTSSNMDVVLYVKNEKEARKNIDLNYDNLIIKQVDQPKI